MSSHEFPREPAPFDPAAPAYDTDFTETTLARWLRELVWEQIADIFRPGDHVLELGCGTGEDALWLARRGVRVTATDASGEMLEVGRLKVEGVGLLDWVTFQKLDIGYSILGIGSIPNIPYPISHIFSNFGPLNCLSERKTLAEGLAKVVPPGGKVVLVVMGPFCLWEMAWYLGHLQFRTAFRRWRAGIPAHTGGGGMVRVWYPSPARLRAEFAPHFRLMKTVGIGAFLPPSYLSHFVDRWPGFFGRLREWERRWGGVFPWTWVNDHYLMVLERV